MMFQSLPNLPGLPGWGSFDELYRQQEKRLRETLRWARRSPFYRARIPDSDLTNGFSDLAGMPITTKQDLRESYPFGMLAVPRSELATYHESSGTTGEPTSSYLTDEDWYEMATRFGRNAVHLSPTDTVLIRTPYSMLITAHQAHQAARLRGATVVPADNRSLLMPYSRVIRLLRDLDVTVAWCLPTECFLWAAAAREAGLKPDSDFPALRAFFVAGEPLSAARRKRIEALWGGRRVYEDYGSTETGSLGGECPAGQVHLWADRFLGEVYDPKTGRSSREGRGQLLITSLYRKAMPLVRYNIEDVVELSERDCDCGWRLPVIRVFGRAAGGIDVSGVRITQDALEELVLALPVEQNVLFWRARAHSRHVEMEIEVAEDQAELACAELTAAVQSVLGVRCEVRALPPGSLVPHGVLVGDREFAKPRSLFAANENWDRAVLYY